jgi:hypothetical protein
MTTVKEPTQKPGTETAAPPKSGPQQQQEQNQQQQKQDGQTGSAEGWQNLLYRLFTNPFFLIVLVFIAVKLINAYRRHTRQRPVKDCTDEEYHALKKRYKAMKKQRRRESGGQAGNRRTRHAAFE